MMDSPTLKRIKNIQANEKKNWKGIQTDFCGKPGISILL
jgi:hypothetical protein